MRWSEKSLDTEGQNTGASSPCSAATLAAHSGGVAGSDSSLRPGYEDRLRTQAASRIATRIRFRFREGLRWLKQALRPLVPVSLPADNVARAWHRCSGSNRRTVLPASAQSRRSACGCKRRWHSGRGYFISIDQTQPIHKLHESAFQRDIGFDTP